MRSERRHNVKARLRKTWKSGGSLRGRLLSEAGCSQKSVSLILKKLRETSSVKDKKNSGRLRVTTRREDSIIVRKSLSNRCKTAPQIRSEVMSEHSIEISTSTTQRRLRDAEIFGRKARKKPCLTPTCKRARLAFARAHKDWTAEQWSRVIFSDESRFLLFRSDG